MGRTKGSKNKVSKVSKDDGIVDDSSIEGSDSGYGGEIDLESSDSVHFVYGDDEGTIVNNLGDSIPLAYMKNPDPSLSESGNYIIDISYENASDEYTETLVACDGDGVRLRDGDKDRVIKRRKLSKKANPWYRGVKGCCFDRDGNLLFVPAYLRRGCKYKNLIARETLNKVLSKIPLNQHKFYISSFKGSNADHEIGSLSRYQNTINALASVDLRLFKEAKFILDDGGKSRLARVYTTVLSNLRNLGVVDQEGNIIYERVMAFRSMFKVMQYKGSATLNGDHPDDSRHLYTGENVFVHKSVRECDLESHLRSYNYFIKEHIVNDYFIYVGNYDFDWVNTLSSVDYVTLDDMNYYFMRAYEHTKLRRVKARDYHEFLATLPNIKHIGNPIELKATERILTPEEYNEVVNSKNVVNYRTDRSPLGYIPWQLLEWAQSVGLDNLNRKNLINFIRSNHNEFTANRVQLSHLISLDGSRAIVTLLREYLEEELQVTAPHKPQVLDARLNRIILTEINDASKRLELGDAFLFLAPDEDVPIGKTKIKAKVLQNQRDKDIEFILNAKKLTTESMKTYLALDKQRKEDDIDKGKSMHCVVEDIIANMSSINLNGTTIERVPRAHPIPDRTGYVTDVNNNSDIIELQGNAKPISQDEWLDELEQEDN